MNTIILVDTDISFKDRMDKKLKVDMIADKYKFHLICPDTTLERKDDLIQHCVKSVQVAVEREDNVIGIFVDVVIVEGGRKRDSTGIDIAIALREHLPSMPILNMTGKYSDDESDVEIISRATLEDVDGVLIKSFLEGTAFSAQRLQNIFDKARSKRGRYTYKSKSESHSHPPSKIERAYNSTVLSPRVKSQIEQVGEFEFWTILEKLLPDSEGVVTYIKPGRSGAFVFRVKAKIKQVGKQSTHPKAWLIKISSDVDLLRLEVENYLELSMSPLHRAFYPKLLEVGLVNCGSVAGFAVELEESAASLFDIFTSLSEAELEKVLGGIYTFINTTYGDGEKKYCYVWKEYFALRESVKQNILMTFEQYKKIFEELANGEFREVSNFIETEGAGLKPLTEYEGEVDIRRIHGDFNGGNLLFQRSDQLIFIDLSSRANNHAAKDIAKLERDIIFRVYDGLSPKYYDWSRADKWHKFSDLNVRGSVFAGNISYDGCDESLKKCLDFIVANRTNLKKVVPAISEEQYLMAILHYSLLAIAHPEISIHKKVFGVQYINHILNYFR